MGRSPESPAAHSADRSVSVACTASSFCALTLSRKNTSRSRSAASGAVKPSRAKGLPAPRVSSGSGMARSFSIRSAAALPSAAQVMASTRSALCPGASVRDTVSAATGQTVPPASRPSAKYAGASR